MPQCHLGRELAKSLLVPLLIHLNLGIMFLRQSYVNPSHVDVDDTLYESGDLHRIVHLLSCPEHCFSPVDCSLFVIKFGPLISPAFTSL